MNAGELLRDIARKLPRLRDAHRQVVDVSQGQVESSLNDVEVKLHASEEACAQAPPAIQHALEALRGAVDSARRLFPGESAQELVRLTDQMMSLLEAPALADALRSAEATAAAAPTSDREAVGHVRLECNGLTVSEVQALTLGLQLGLQLGGSSQATPSLDLPPELEHSELARALEALRVRAGELH